MNPTFVYGFSSYEKSQFQTTRHGMSEMALHHQDPKNAKRATVLLFDAK